MAIAWRELRRAISRPSFRSRLYGEEVLEIAQLDALQAITNNADCRMSELAEVLRVDASTATRVADRLVKAGYAARRPDPLDARARTLVATEVGEEMLERTKRSARARLPEILEGFDAAELDVLAGLLERLVSAVDEFSAGPCHDESRRSDRGERE